MENIDHIVELAKDLNKLQNQQLSIVEPLVREAMTLGIQDSDYLGKIIDPLSDLAFWGVGQELYDEFLNYIESFDPQRAKVYRDSDDELNGVYDDLVLEASNLAKELHKGQVDKQGVDYFEGHLTTVGNAGHGWKEKVVGFLHDAAEDTHYAVDEIVRVLKEKSNGILKDDDAQEIYEALNLLNSKTASSRADYIDRLKDSFLATKVKLNDLVHNMDMSRISNPTEKDMERLKRYRREYRQVLGYLGPVMWEYDEGFEVVMKK